MRALSLWNKDFWGPLGRFEDLAKDFQQGLNLPVMDPTCDIVEDKNQYRVVVDLPGLKKEEVNIEVHEDRLTISGERKFETKNDEDTRHWIGRAYGRFERSFTLPSFAHTEKTEAKFEDGVLTVTIPKVEASKPKQIRVS